MGAEFRCGTAQVALDGLRLQREPLRGFGIGAAERDLRQHIEFPWAQRADGRRSSGQGLGEAVGEAGKIAGCDVLARGATQFKDTIDACRTRLYFIGDSEKWSTESKRADAFFEQFRQELATLRQQQAVKK